VTARRTFADVRIHPLAAPVAVGVLAAATCAFVAWADPTTPGGLIPPCPTKALFDIPCPGCGSARMLASVVNGDLGAALRYNAVGLFALVVLTWTYTAWWRARATGSPGRPWQNRPLAPYVVLALTVGWFVVRALPVEPFLSLRV
jgi:hypothetical protein